MGVNVTRVVKFIRKGDKGSDAVRYWLIPSVSSVSMSDVENGDGKPTPSSVSCRLVKQVGDDTPTTIADASSVGLTIQYTILRNDGVITALQKYSGAVTVPTNTACRAIEFYLYRGSQVIDVATVVIVCDGKQGQPGLQGLQGEKGEQGIPGSNGTNGKTSYFHIKYSNVENPTTAAQMTETPSTYIGTYVDFVEADSSDPKRYIWHRFQGLQGEKGEQGIPGVGEDGKTTYLHIKYSNDGGKSFTANNGETPGDWIGYCTDFNAQDPSNVNSYKWSKIKGEAGTPGADGEDAISIKVSPQTMILKRNGKVQTHIRVYVDLFKGETQIPYGDDTQGNMLCSTLTGSDRKITDGLTWGFNTDNGRFYYYFTYSGTTDINMEIPFTVTYNGKSYPEKIIVKTVADGDRGPTLRGPQAWSDCATGYGFQCGAEGEAWKDVVLYGNNYYSCVKSHAKTADNYPGSTADQSNGYWQLGDKIELVATKILLASYALVKNLGVECIDMRDAAGNILFQVKGGNVTCKTGTFENIKVSGDITAEYLNLKLSTANHYETAPALANGSICIQASGIILPELPAGTARSMRVLNPLMSRTTPQDLVLKPATTNVLISKSLSELEAVNSNVTLSSCGYNGNKYMELIGIHRISSDYTVWLMSEMNKGITE